MTRKTCPSCNGAGTIPTKRDNRIIKITCPMCGGTGDVETAPLDRGSGVGCALIVAMACAVTLAALLALVEVWFGVAR